MLLTRNGVALPLLFSCGLVARGGGALDAGDGARGGGAGGGGRRDAVVGELAADEHDRGELQLVRALNAVKQAMAAGATCVLLNFDDLYESLYDVLNRRFVSRVDPKTGRVQACLRLAIGSRSHLCPVAASFKVIVVTEEAHALERLDLPLLNRFEKQLFAVADCLDERERALSARLRAWCERVADESALASVEAAFCGSHEGLVPSVVRGARASFEAARAALAALLTPEAVVGSAAAQEVCPLAGYLARRSSLHAAVRELMADAGGADVDAVLLTRSPVAHIDAALAHYRRAAAADGAAAAAPARVEVLELALQTSERDVRRLFARFLAPEGPDATEGGLLLVQCDPIQCRQAMINHARLLLSLIHI